MVSPDVVCIGSDYFVVYFRVSIYIYMFVQYLEKILIYCRRLALRINKDGTTKMTKQSNEKNEKTKVVQKKWRKQRKAGKVEQVIEGDGVQVGTCERPGRCQPSTLRKKIQVSYFEVHVYVSHGWMDIPGFWS